MARLSIRLASLCVAGLLAFSVFAVHAQDADSDSAPPTEQDAQDVLGQRAQPPDLSRDDTPIGVRQGDNAGTTNVTIPAENTTETVTTSSEHSSGFSIGADTDDYRSRMPVAGEIANQPPPPPGWPGHDRANRPQTVYAGPVARIPAGPIWNNNDAQGKCPSVCGRNQMGWTGDWRTVGFNKSECDCAAYGNYPPPPGMVAPGPGTYCEAPPNFQCAGCSVHCPGNQVAHCAQGERGIFNKPESTVCGKDAVCQCR